MTEMTTHAYPCLQDFTKDESGAVTTDWVVLTASIVGLAILSVSVVRSGTISLGSGIEENLGEVSVSELEDQRVGGEEKPETTQGTDSQRAPEEQATDGEAEAEEQPQIIRGTDPQRGRRAG